MPEFSHSAKKPAQHAESVAGEPQDVAAVTDGEDAADLFIKEFAQAEVEADA